MVYNGRPSRGCQICRTRRIKCDETKPTCNQCTKSRRQCSGYKNEFDVMFRNETKATERRAQKANRTALAPKRAVGGEMSTVSASPTDEGSAIAPPIMVPPDQQANCYFMSNFVLYPRRGGSRGFMDYLPFLLKQEPASSCLKHAFNACSFAALGNRVSSNSISFAEEALSEYTKAISGVHATLKDPKSAKQDSTLASILLLGFFENISAKQMGSFAWGSHIDGAIQLVKMRGKRQLRTKTGMQLFIAVRSMMMIHALLSGKAPIHGTYWWMVEASLNHETGAECHRLNIMTAELRHEINRVILNAARTPDNIELMLSLIRRAQTYDHDCVTWMSLVPKHWRFKTVAWEDNDPGGDYKKADVFPGRVDIYPDIWTSCVWNQVHCCRIILASIIVRCAAWVCAPIDYRTTPEYATASRTVVETVTDIIASIPFNLGWHLRRTDIMADHGLSSFACGEDHCLKGLAGYYVTWPLACLNSQDYITDAQRAWVVGRLRFVGEELGVHYALHLTQLNVRIPSMLIRRNGLMASPIPTAYNFERLLSEDPPGRTHDSAGYT